MSHTLLVDMMHTVVGKLVVIARAPNKGDTARWLCLCECGEEIVMYGYVLRRAQAEGKVLGCLSCRQPRKHVEVKRRKHGKLSICEDCGNMPHRVRTPPKCETCGTLAGEDKITLPWRTS